MALHELIKPIRLNEHQQRQLGGVLTEIVRDLEQSHSQAFDNIRIHWKWYWAEPKVRVKSWPWPNASNMVAPVIMTQADARTAQDFALLWGAKDKFYTGSSENEEFVRSHLSEVMRFANFAVRAEINPFWAIHDWIHERNVIGGAVIAATWEEDERYLFTPGGKRPQRVVTKRGVRWTHWPAEMILWEPGLDVRESDIVATQRLLRWGDITKMVQGQDGYDKDAVRRLFEFPHEHGSPGAEVRAEKEERAGIDPTLNVSRRRSFDVRTLWIDWPALEGMGVPGLRDAAVVQDDETGERTILPLIVELVPDSREVIRVLPNQYLTVDGNPFFAAYYKRQVGYPRGVGLSKILEQPQRGETTVLNQSLDARTLQISVPFKTTNTKLRERPITPNGGMYVESMGDAEPFAIPGAGPTDPMLVNLLQVFAERIGGSNDPVLGRESRSGGHPSPATNYMGQLQQAAKMAATPTLILGETLSQLGLYTLGLYQQFDTDPTGRIERVFGKPDAKIIQSWLFPVDMTLVGNLQISLTALSDENPQVAMQQAMVVSQATQQYAANVIRVMQLVSNPQAPQPLKDAALQSLRVLGDTHQRFLEAANYDEAREAIFRLEGGDDNAIQQLYAIAQQQLSGAAPGAGAGAGVAAPSGGSPVPPSQPTDVPLPGGPPADAGGGLPELPPVQ